MSKAILHLPDGSTVIGKSVPITFTPHYTPGDTIYDFRGSHLTWSELPSGAEMIILGVAQADGTLKKHRVETGKVKP